MDLVWGRGAAAAAQHTERALCMLPRTHMARTVCMVACGPTGLRLSVCIVLCSIACVDLQSVWGRNTWLEHRGSEMTLSTLDMGLCVCVWGGGGHKQVLPFAQCQAGTGW